MAPNRPWEYPEARPRLQSIQQPEPIGFWETEDGEVPGIPTPPPPPPTTPIDDPDAPEATAVSPIRFSRPPGTEQPVPAEPPEPDAPPPPPPPTPPPPPPVNPDDLPMEEIEAQRRDTGTRLRQPEPLTSIVDPGLPSTTRPDPIKEFRTHLVDNLVNQGWSQDEATADIETLFAGVTPPIPLSEPAERERYEAPGWEETALPKEDLESRRESVTRNFGDVT